LVNGDGQVWIAYIWIQQHYLSILAYDFNLICKVIYDPELIQQLEHFLGTMCMFAKDVRVGCTH
jgi:hypothetical protein